MSRVDARYICQSAANAIISEIGPYRVSNDALQAINHFLDEYLVLLLTSSLSLDLSRIKAVVFTLLPSTLGKNAIVEAELEVKTFTETEAIDYESYERMRMLGTDGQPEFPVNDALPLLREKCLEFCTLADREEQRAYMDPAITPTARQNIAIVPIVAIYVTTVLEHIAEYVLTAIAMTAEHEDTEYIRIKQVFLALVDDIQVGGVFHRMELRDKLEKRAFAMGYKPRTPVPSFHAAAAAPPPPNHMRSSTSGSNNNGGDGFLDICFDDLDIGYDDDVMNPNDRLSVSQYSMRSGVSQRPTSMMSGSTSNGTLSTFDNSSANSSKKAYKVFRKDDGGADRSPLSVSVYDPDAPAMNFEDLIRSGNTMKVSLTPNRLKSIEVKNQMVDDTPKSTSWERRSTASSASRATRSLNGTATASSSSAPRRNVSSMSAVPNSSKPKHGVSAPPPPAATHHHTVKPKSSFGSDRSIKKPSSATAPMPPLPEQKKPAGPLDTRFENPREAPKPPTITTTTNNSASPPSSASPVVVQSPAPITSTPKPVPEKPTNDTSSVKKEQQPQRPRLLRRSSSSSKKSRENLRRQREKEEQEEQRKKAEAALRGLPKPTTPEDVDNESQEQQKEKASLSSKSSNESVSRSITSSNNNDAAPPSPPASEGSNKDQEKGVHFDNERSSSPIVDEPERPSSMTAKRASLVGSSRRQSLHESYAMNDIMRHRLSAAGSVEMTVKAFDSMSKSNIQDVSNTTTPTSTTPTTTTTTTTGRRSPVTMPRRSASVEQGNSSHGNGNHGDEEVSSTTTPTPPAMRAPRPSSVLDKVMQFERANSLDDSAQQHHRQQRTASYMPRRERFLYLQREPGLLERRSTTYTTTANASPRPVTVDAGVQTDPVLLTNHDEDNDGPPALVITDETGVSISKSIHVSDSENLSDKSSEHGLVEGDEEWFLQDDEWDDVQDQENAVVEWLLGEA